VRVFAWAALVLTLLGAAPALALEVEIDSDTSFQAYDVRAFGAGAFHARRRFLSRLSLRLSHAFTEPDEDGRVVRLIVDAQLRLDQDFGETCLVDSDLCIRAVDEEDPSTWQPLAADTRVDLPSIAAEVNGLPLGISGRIGRQLLLDEIGFARFDGARMSAAPIHWIDVDVYGGLLVRGTSIAGTPRSDPQGSIRLGTERDVPWAEPPSDTWIVGASVEGNAGRWLRLRFGARHLWEEDGAVATRVSGALSSSPTDWLRLSCSAVLDVLTAEFIDALAEIAVGDRALTVRATLEHHEPRFDPGTVWAWFSAAPIDQLSIGARWLVSEQVELGGSLRGRRAELETQEEDDLDAGVEAYARARWEGFHFSVSGFAWSGSLGPVAGVTLEIARPFLPWLELAIDASVWHFDDPLRDDLYGTVVSESVSGTIRLSPETLLFLELSHAASRVVGHRFRGMIALRVDTWR
jgi:hypothetical protein